MKMKRIITVVLTVTIIGGAAGAAMAWHGPGGGFGGPPPEMEMGAVCGEEQMACMLKLSTLQRDQIKVLREAEQEQVKPLFDKMRAAGKRLMQAIEAPVFDEVAVRSIAADHAQAEMKLIMVHAGVQSRINALLTPEQRELQKNMRPEPGHRPPPPEK